jgi:hypothetical protein
MKVDTATYVMKLGSFSSRIVIRGKGSSGSLLCNRREETSGSLSAPSLYCSSGPEQKKDLVEKTMIRDYR